MGLLELHVFPIVTGMVFVGTFFLNYLIAVLLQHTEFDWPYISDTGAYPPESCIFGQLMNIGAVLLGITVYIRYKQVHEFFTSHQIGQLSTKVNKLGLYLGFLGALGISIVANFQETAVYNVHLCGALMAFGVGTLYMWIQVYSSFKLSSITHSARLTYFRLMLAIVCSLSFVVMLPTGIVAHMQFDGSDPTKWYPTNKGWGLHLCSTISEWVMAMGFNIYILTFATEFKKVTLDSPRICLRIRETSHFLVRNDVCDDLDIDVVANNSVIRT